MSQMRLEDTALGARRSARKSAVLLVIPFFTLGYQIAAKEIANTLGGAAFGWRWAQIMIGTPWLALLLGCELASLIVWIAVLSEIKLSTAFPMTAFAYLLVIGVSWGVFHEPINVLTIVGSATILLGVWLIGRDADETAS